MKEILEKDGVYICPECGSKRITEVSQNILLKMVDVNTEKLINPETGRKYFSNRHKARAYDNASPEGVGCWHYECRRCGWTSGLLVE